MSDHKKEKRYVPEHLSVQGKKRVRIRPVLLAAALTGCSVFTLLDAFVIPRDIVTLESVQAAASEDTAAEDSAAASEDTAAEDSAAASEDTAANTQEDQPAAENAGDENGTKHKHKPDGKGSGSGRPGSGKKKSGKKGSGSSENGSSDEQKENRNQSESSREDDADSADAGSQENQSGETTETAAVTSDSYQADGVSVTLTEKRVYDTEVYIADIQLDDPAQLLSGLADNSFGRNLSQKTSEMASSLGAVLAINGDYYGFRDTGYVMRNGYLYRSTARSGSGNEDLVIYDDGTMEVIDESEVTAEELAEKGAVQIYSFGPGLISGGTVTVTEGDEVDQSMRSNPRTAIGMVEPGHYVMVVSDGRTDESAGLSLAQLAEVMQSAGCTEAYNLDGGGSTTMWFNGEIINNPTGGRGSNERAVSDIVYIEK